MSRSRSSTGSKRVRIDFKRMWFGNLNREFIPDLIKNDGEFLLRRGGDGGRVLSVNASKKLQHFKFAENTKVYTVGSTKYPSLEELVVDYYESGRSLNRKTTIILKTPVYNTFETIDPRRVVFEKVLGKGNFGEVWKASLMPEKETVAVKIIGGNASDKDRADCMAEAKLMSILEHENVVRLIGLSFWTQNPATLPKLLIVLEFCNYGSLDKLLEKGLVEDRGKIRALLDAAKGLEYLHKREVIHRDIASRNILVNQSQKRFICKVADFGLSRLAPDHYELVTKRRLPIFATAPETLKMRDWTSESDVWSFGILIHEVYNGSKNPYEQQFLGVNVKVLMEKLGSGVRVPIPPEMPTVVGDLVTRCLDSKRQNRPSMTEVVHILREYHVASNRR